MKNRTITWGLAGIVIGLLAIFFIFQNIFFDKGNLVENTLNNINQAVSQEDWAKAEKITNEFQTIWNRGKYLIALNYAEMGYLDLASNLEELKGAIEAKDKAQAVQSVRKIKGRWINFRRVIPEP